MVSSQFILWLAFQVVVRRLPGFLVYLVIGIVGEKSLRDGTIRRYTYTYRKLCEFIGRKNFIIRDEEIVSSIDNMPI